MQTERTPLTPAQIRLVVDTLQAEVEQAARSLETAYEAAKTIEYSTDLHAPGGHWYYVGEAAHHVAENLGGRGSEIDPELALRHVGALRDLVALAISRDDPLEGESR